MFSILSCALTCIFHLFLVPLQEIDLVSNVLDTVTFSKKMLGIDMPQSKHLLFDSL